MEDHNQQAQFSTSDIKGGRGTTQQGSFDGRTETAGMAVISTVATRSDTDPAELDPLWNVVNPDALDALFQPGAVGQVAFTYSGYEVVVHSDGDIGVTEANE